MSSPRGLRGRLPFRRGPAARRRRPDGGSAAVEAAILVPALLTFILLAIAAGRIQTAASTVEAAARAAARTASITREPGAVDTAARAAADDVLRQDGVSCQRLDIDLQRRALETPAGNVATMVVVVACEISLRDVLVPGMPGTKSLRGEFTSVVDRYRGQ
ncbi:pilus assembly protein [Kitasatospora sp. NBC_00240]|uniref:TadE family protein n=1 Tax=Kitasatospora sp. NBC_00240 TaxID=2903567 RepID=UPI002255BDFD|nr:TadE family protein [Kitasatospora sp. NBC_00240]MCX5209478.1 pilus assembly protein [Kitasatospora sp. NBC_00240]